MIRVLHIMACSDVGGISTVVLNYYRFLDRTQIQFDIALTVPEIGRNARELQALGAKIHFLPLKSEGIGAFLTALRKLLETEAYDAVHVHESETCYVALMVAGQMGIPCRIAHAHTASPWEGVKGELRRLSGCLLNYPASTHVIGCGELAGERVFGKWNMRRPKAVVLPNAIDTQRFVYDEEARRQLRAEWNLEGKLVLGMVGRLCVEKNYPFALELVAKLRQEHPACKLVIVGDGEEREAIEGKIQALDISDHVLLLGKRSDVHRVYQAFDIFLLPSFTEGYPVAAVEALSAGLPALLSDAVTGELRFGTAVEYLPLKEPQKWLEAIHRWEGDTGRQARQSEPAEHGLDIRTCAKRLETIYLEDIAQGRKGSWRR